LSGIKRPEQNSAQLLTP